MTRVLSETEAMAWVLALLADGKPRTTRTIDESARAQGVGCPDGTARFLARMHRKGLVQGELDVAAKSWRWWKASAGHA